MPHLSWLRRRLATAIALAVLALLATVTGGLPARAAPQQAATAVAAMNCRAESVPVTLAGTSTVMTGQLCSRGDPHGKALMAVLAGFTYDHHYWNWPQDPSRYSFAYAATLAGYDVLALDQPGTPPADQVNGVYPPASAVTIPDMAAALHELITATAAGALQGIRFPSIIVGGHSGGSAIAVTYAATYHDPAVKGLIVTGFLRDVNPAGNALSEAGTYPAQDDPKFAAAGLPDGYITTRAPSPPGSYPSARAAEFYSPGDSNPAVIREDEALKSTTTIPAVAGIPAAQDPALSQKVTIPVDLLVGQNDVLFCSTTEPCTSTATVLSRERADFSSAPSLQGLVLPGSGHSINLAANAPVGFIQEITWALGVTGGHTLTSPWRAFTATWTQHGNAHGAR